MKARLLAGMALPVVAGFALGMATAPRAETGAGAVSSSNQAAPDHRTVTALTASSKGTAAMLSRVAAHPSAGGFSKLMAYMKLVRSAEVEEYPELVDRIRREVSGGEMSHADFLINLLVKRWAEEDPLGAMSAMLEGRPEEMWNQRWLLMNKMAGEHPREAWLGIRSMQDRGRRAQLERDFLENVSGQQPEIALEIMADLNPFGEAMLLRSSLGRVAIQRPLKALAFIETLPAGALGTGRVSFKIDGELHTSQQLGRGRDNAAVVVATGWAQSDPQAAVAWAEQQEGTMRAAALSASVKQWGSREPVAALDYARTNLESDGQMEVLDEVLVSRNLPLEKRREIAETYGGQPMPTRGYNEFAQTWIHRDAAGLGAWLAERPGSATDELMKHAATQWAAQSPEDAVREVAEIADPAMREVAINAVAKRFRANLRLGLGVGTDFDMAPEVQAAVDALAAQEAEGGGQ